MVPNVLIDVSIAIIIMMLTDLRGMVVGWVDPGNPTSKVNVLTANLEKLRFLYDERT
jgi:hypothetical protein